MTARDMTSTAKRSTSRLTSAWAAPAGKLVAWGSGDYEFGQTNVPADLKNVVQVAGGDFFSLALRRDGTVAVWGYAEGVSLTPPEYVSNVVAIAAGIVKSHQGKIWCESEPGQGATFIVEIPEAP